MVHAIVFASNCTWQHKSQLVSVVHANTQLVGMVHANTQLVSMVHANTQLVGMVQAIVPGK